MFIFVAVILIAADSTMSTKTYGDRDLVVHYYDRNVSTIDLLMRLNMSYANFDVRSIECPLSKYSCEAICPLDNEGEERVHKKSCYCDKSCVELGDCCFDYFLRCAAAKMTTPSPVKSICMKATNSDDYGYAVINSCPPNGTDNSLESLCTTKSSTTDLFGMLPVTDLQTKITYQNAFCARCNRASNETYWNFLASCKGVNAFDIPRNRSLMLEFIKAKCEWSFEPPRDSRNHLKRCLSLKRTCSNSELLEIEPLLTDLCSFYTFPVCGNIQNKNLHCDICRRKDISTYSCYDCRSGLVPGLGLGEGAEQGPPGRPGQPPIPSLDILFDFSSNSHKIQVGNKKTVVKNKECDEAFLFDPFNEKCIPVYVPNMPGRILAETASIKSWENETNFNGLENATNIKASENGTYPNCSFVEMNISSVILTSNGSIWIPMYKREYTNESYVIKGSSLFLCVDFKRTYSLTETLASRRLAPKEVITYTGLAISVISLILLLCIYIAVAELRTLPGKNLMSLSCAMLLYHIVFSLTGQTDRPYLCMTVSILLHYFLLSSFCWMGVMAFDVAKTFGTTGQISRSRSNNDDIKKAFLIYSTFAWTVPAAIVITSVVLDETDTAFIGYADHICWISNGKALLVVLGVPVALILMFNFVALSIAMVSIWKVQKTTRRVADQSNQTSLPILYIKLSSTLGFTWILGFIVPFANVRFLTYLFVVLNSLQGFFMFLAFVANKRTINKVKAGWRARFHRLENADDIRTKSKQTQSSKLVTTSL